MAESTPSNLNADPKCLFCAIVQGNIPSYKIHETEHTLAFLDIAPISEGHTQVIPKYHAQTLLDMPDDYLREIGPAIKQVAFLTGAEQYNILQNNGKMAFQHVGHVHFHVIPKPSETEGLILSEAQTSWPTRKVTPEQLAAVQTKMKGRL